jgi:ABC-2 type transport system permease protein
MKMIDICAVAKYEFIQIFRSRKVMFVLLLIPLLCGVFIGFIYHQGKIIGLPLAVYDADRSSLARELINHIASSETFGEIYYAENFREVDDWIERGVCRAAVIIPENFASDVTEGRPTKVLAIADGTNILYPNNALTSIGEVVKTFSAKTGIRIMLGKKILPQEGVNILSALQFREHPLYNPTYNYSYFLVFGILIALWQLASFMGVAASFAREREENTWLQFMVSPLSKWQIIAGKVIPYFFINLFQITFLYVFGVWVLHLPMRGSILLLFLLTCIFLFVVIGLGVLCSIIGDSPLNATRYGMVIFLPSFILSGYTWPLEAMPVFIQFIASLLPLTWMLQGFRNITMKGLGWEAVWQSFAVLTVMAVLFCACSILLLKKYEPPSLKEVLAGVRVRGFSGSGKPVKCEGMQQ